MDRLAPHHVPLYETDQQRDELWNQCVDRGDPVIAVRNARRGFIVRYDLQHLDTELTEPAIRRLRDRTRSWRTYPTGADPLSEAEGVGGEAGPVSGDLHTDTESRARDLAARLSTVVFDRSNWQ